MVQFFSSFKLIFSIYIFDNELCKLNCADLEGNVAELETRLTTAELDINGKDI